MTILMVDDSPDARNLCRTLLQEIYDPSFMFLQAGKGERGLALCAKKPPDCVLLDYHLPDMSGLEFLRKLADSAPAVVMLTGFGSDKLAVEALKAGAQDYLVKDNISAEGLRMAVEKAIEKLRLIRTLKSERDRLTASVCEQEALVQEIHHRVKNNLQVIASLLKLQADALRSGQNDPATQALRESQTRVESMALIHEQLYQSKNLREIDLAQHASVIANRLMHSYGATEQRISLRVKMKALPLGVDRAVPAGLILNELISNALRHAFAPDHRGSLSIEGNRVQGVVTLEVADNGCGFPHHVNIARPKTLGLQIVGILVRQLKGAFRVDRENEFTRCRVTFPEH